MKREEDEQAKQDKNGEAKGLDKWNLGLLEVTSNQNNFILWMEHKRERVTPSFLFVAKDDEPCRSCNYKVLNSKWLF